MRNNDKVGYLAKNTFLFTISSFGSKLLTFLLVPLYTNVLTTAEYGTADIVHTTSTLLIYIFTLNIADAVLRYAIESKDNTVEYLSFGIKVLGIGSVVFLACEVFIARLSIISWDANIYLYLFLTFIVTALNQILSNYLRAIDKIMAVAISGILTTVITIISNMLLLLVLKIVLDGYLISIIAGNLASCIYILIINRSELSLIIKSNPGKQTKLEMIRYSTPLIFNGVAWWINNSLDKYFIIAIRGAALNGIYAVSYKIPTILSVFQTIFNQAWNLSAIREFDKNDEDRFFSNTYNCYNEGLVVLCSVLILLNRPIAKILFAKDFYEAWHYAPILLISVVFMSLSGFLGSIFTAVKNSKIFAISTISAAIVNTTLNAALIPNFGGYGAAIATAISFFVVWIIRLICSRKYIKFKINFINHIACYILLAVQTAVDLFAQSSAYIINFLLLIIILILNIKSITTIYNRVYRFVVRK